MNGFSAHSVVHLSPGGHRRKEKTGGGPLKDSNLFIIGCSLIMKASHRQKFLFG